MALSELLCTDLASVEAALALGADRIELCAALEVGGVTPGPGLLAAAVGARDAATSEGSRTEVVVLVRPRRGDFVYDAGDLAALRADVEAAARAGADGVALGVLTSEGAVDVARTGELVEAAGPMAVTFHRAFDHVADPRAAAEALEGLGVRRLLTSGGAPSAWEGRRALRDLVAWAGDRLEVVAAGGITGANASDVLDATGAPAIHGSCARVLQGRAAPVALGKPGAPAESGRLTLDADDAARFVAAAAARAS
jgi:copper homeostasis protein